MFKRRLLLELEKWRQNIPRKPLVIRGARQVGKTTLVNQFAAQYEQWIFHSKFTSISAQSLPPEGRC